MRRRLWQRLALIAAAAGAATVLIGGYSLALFSSAALGETGTFAAGSVVLTGSATACNVTLLPGVHDDRGEGDDPSGTEENLSDDHGDGNSDMSQGNGQQQPYDRNQPNDGSPGGTYPACTYQIAYSGSLAAWIGLDVSTSSTSSAPGRSALLDGTASGLQVQISDAQTPSNAFGTGSITCQSLPGQDEVCSSSDPNQVVKASGSFVNGDGSVNSGWTDTFTVDYSLSSQVTSAYQGSSATIMLTAHAVQASNNPLTNGQPVSGWS